MIQLSPEAAAWAARLLARHLEPIIGEPLARVVAASAEAVAAATDLIEHLVGPEPPVVVHAGVVEFVVRPA